MVKTKQILFWILEGVEQRFSPMVNAECFTTKVKEEEIVKLYDSLLVNHVFGKTDIETDLAKYDDIDKMLLQNFVNQMPITDVWKQISKEVQERLLAIWKMDIYNHYRKAFGLCKDSFYLFHGEPTQSELEDTIEKVIEARKYLWNNTVNRELLFAEILPDLGRM